MSYDMDEERARDYAMRFQIRSSGLKVMAELPNPVNFDAATAHIGFDEVAENVPCGPDPLPPIEAIREFVDAGFDESAWSRSETTRMGSCAGGRMNWAPNSPACLNPRL
jgi:hypothetical protein